MIKVAIVEDKAETLKYLEALLAGSNGIQMVGAYATGNDALAGIQNRVPDVVMVDIGLPDISGIDVIRALKDQFPDLDIIAHTMYEDRIHLVAALKAGASGYILKGASASKIIEAVEEIADGGSPMSPKIARYIIEEFQSNTRKRDDIVLTPREKEVLQGIAQGKQEKTLAEDFSLSPHTIHTYVKNIYKKLRVGSQVEAVLKAKKSGII